MITIIGSINFDLIARSPKLPEPGETLTGRDFSTAAGGKGANQALAAARAGVPVRMVGAVGSDAFAPQAVALLRAEGVDLTRVATRGDATGIALITVEDSGENTIIVIPGANGLVTEDDVNVADLDGGFLLLQMEVPLPALEKAIATSETSDTTCILNTAPWRDDAASLLPRADIIVANETEFDLASIQLELNGADRKAKMIDFAEHYGRTVIVTLGAEGVMVATPDEHYSLPALAIKPVDTVGAGDTFCGYLAAGLDSGLTLRDACQRAAKAASLACLKAGAQPSIPYAAEVQ
ncbi:ribokinase [Pseudochrobactrum sp. sp1633]|uniref:ribokinase n=1 Tax=Pseudochrobactrum sp. sp1633 TaxID=3036706 RepID=UPI0025A58A1F|nr:ribokinase [Pseudochrobactrum sp. sp1633]MDM8344320.1 ribokinase [Pseudochrobactrum sp. sp1633]HWD14548.1 ribokinase [Pseudochrobactrum sp.]